MSPVEVWSIDLGGAAAPPGTDASALGPDEQRRAERMSGPRRREFTRSHAAVRALLADRLGCDRASLRWRLGPAGKPGPARAATGPGVHWNLSHAAGRALVAVSESGPVGVDLVRLSELREPARIVRRFFTARERRAVREARPESRDLVCARLLARKEACVKALGIRLLEGLGIDTADAGSAIDHAGIRLRLHDLVPRPGWAAAVAAVGDAPVTTVEQTWHWPRTVKGGLS